MNMQIELLPAILLILNLPTINVMLREKQHQSKTQQSITLYKVRKILTLSFNSSLHACIINVDKNVLFEGETNLKVCLFVDFFLSKAQFNGQNISKYYGVHSRQIVWHYAIFFGCCFF